MGVQGQPAQALFFGTTTGVGAVGMKQHLQVAQRSHLPGKEHLQSISILTFSHFCLFANQTPFP